MSKDQQNIPLKGLYAVITAIFLWGVLPIYWKQIQAVPAEQILANRIVWSFLILLIILIWQYKGAELFRLLRKGQVPVLFASGIIISLNWFTYIYAVNTDRIVEASLGYYINPLLTIFLARAVLKEKISLVQGFAVLLAVIGVGIITFSYGSVPIIALVLAFTFSTYSLLKKKVNSEVILGLSLETLVVLPAAIPFLLLSAHKGELLYSRLSLTELCFLLGTGIITVIPLMLFSYGAKIISLTTVGLIQYMAPTISLFIGIFIYKEPFTATHILTFGFIWAALVIYSCSQIQFYSKHKLFKA